MLKEKIEKLAQLRKDLETATNTYSGEREKFENSDPVKNFKNLTVDVEKLESEIRTEAEKIFKETGEKHPHQTVEVQQKLKISYDEEKALEYAKTELKQAVVLDNGIFKTTIKAWLKKKMTIPAFVKTESTPWVKIDTDLSNYRIPMDEEVKKENEE